jgi:hypothetical protein
LDIHQPSHQTISTTQLGLQPKSFRPSSKIFS